MDQEQSERIRLLAEIATELLGMWRDCEHGYICEVSPHIATSLAELTVDAAEYRQISSAASKCSGWIMCVRSIAA